VGGGGLGGATPIRPMPDRRRKGACSAASVWVGGVSVGGVSSAACSVDSGGSKESATKQRGGERGGDTKEDGAEDGEVEGEHSLSAKWCRRSGGSEGGHGAACGVGVQSGDARGGDCISRGWMFFVSHRMCISHRMSFFSPGVFFPAGSFFSPDVFSFASRAVQVAATRAVSEAASARRLEQLASSIDSEVRRWQELAVEWGATLEVKV